MGRRGRDEAIRALYCYYIDAPVSEFTTGTRWRDWLNGTPPQPASELLGELVDFDAKHSTSKAETSELERLNLASILGFQTPPLRLMVRRRSGSWLVKFVNADVL